MICKHMFNGQDFFFHTVYDIYLCTGADIDVCDKFGNTPLHIAARYGHELLINTLLENGSDPMK